MTILEQLASTVATTPEWTEMVASVAERTSAGQTCHHWSRKGGSHYKDGEFFKK